MCRSTTGRRAVRGTVGAIIASTLIFTAPTAVASEALNDDFESGAATNWTTTSHVVVSAQSAKTGRFGARTAVTPNTASYLAWTPPRITAGLRYARVRGWFEVDSRAAGESVDVFTVKNAQGSHNFDFFLTPRGRWRYDLFSKDSALSTMPAKLGSWYHVEALVDFGGPKGSTYSAKVWINGVAQPSISSTRQVGSTVQAAYFGSAIAGKTAIRHYDDLALDVSGTPLAYMPVPDVQKGTAPDSTSVAHATDSRDRSTRRSALRISGLSALLLAAVAAAGVLRRRQGL